MYPSIDKIKAILLQEHYISEEDSKAAEAAAHDSAGYVEYLIRAELLTKALLGQALAEGLGLPFVDLEINAVNKEQVDRIPEDVARANRAVFIKDVNKVALLATDSPEKVDEKALKEFFPGKKITLAYALPEGLESSFNLYEKPLETRFSQIIS